MQLPGTNTNTVRAQYNVSWRGANLSLGIPYPRNPSRFHRTQRADGSTGVITCGILYCLSRIELTHVLRLHLHPFHSTSIVSMVPYLSYLSSILAPVYVVVRYAFARSKRESRRFRASSLVCSTRRALSGVSLPPFFLHKRVTSARRLIRALSYGAEATR